MIDTTEYAASHGSRPNGSDYGLWILRSKVTGRQIERTGAWSIVKSDLSFSLSNLAEWMLLP